MESTKQCKSCNESKQLDEFYKSGKYYRSYCKLCHGDMMKYYQTKDKGGYGLFENKKCLYVGQSGRLNDRMNKHKTLMNNNDLVVHNPAQTYLYDALTKHKNVIVKVLEYTNDYINRELHYRIKLKPLYNAASKS